MKLRTPAIPLWEVPRAIRTPVPPEPRTEDPAVLSRLTSKMQDDYYRERIDTYGARADAWGRRAEAWLWLVWVCSGVFFGCLTALIASLIVRVAS